MTDDGRGRGSVNLEELERQLREASRSRIRAAAADPALRGTEPSEPPIPDLSALTRQFGPRPTTSQPQVTQEPPQAAPWPTTAPPIAGYEPAVPEVPRSWPSYQATVPQSEPIRPTPAYSAEIAPVEPSFEEPLLEAPRRQPVYQQVAMAPPEMAQPVYSSAQPPQPPQPAVPPPPHDPAPSGYTGLVGDLPRGFGPTVNDRFPALEKEKSKSFSGLRAIVIVVIVALGVFGLYVLQSGRYAVTLGPQSDQKLVPVIKPDPTPVKIAPDNKAAETAPAGSELFKKDTPDNPANVTKRASSEEPVDINAVVKAAPVTKSIIPTMGDPKAVKTVTVRPDGSIVGDPQIAPAKPATDAAPQVAQPPKNVAALAPAPAKTEPVAAPAPPPQPAPAAKPALPPLTGQAADVPLPLPRPSDLDQTAAAASDPLAALVQSATETPTPTETEEPAQPAQSTGDYAVQFGAPGNEADANGLAKKVRTEFAEQIDGRDVVVVKAESNGKTVYRVRAVGYTRDEANAVCGGVGAAGGKCFIARN